MKKFFKAIYEHIITKRKYNTLILKYETAKEDRRKMEAQYEVKKDIFEIRQREWERVLKEQEEQIINLNTEIIELKRRKKKSD